MFTKFYTHQGNYFTLGWKVFAVIEPKQLKVPEKGIPKMDIIFAILLLVATLSTAFCVYQATRWNGIQAVDFGESAKFRTESIRATTTANTQVTIDVQLFMSWVDAVRKDDQIEAEFIKERFRKEFKPAFEAWIAEADCYEPDSRGNTI